MNRKIDRQSVVVDQLVGLSVERLSVGWWLVNRWEYSRWVGGLVVNGRSVVGKTVCWSVVGGGFLSVVRSFVIGSKLKNPL